jgi:hypothetical protein
LPVFFFVRMLLLPGFSLVARKPSAPLCPHFL